MVEKTLENQTAAASYVSHGAMCTLKYTLKENHQNWCWGTCVNIVLIQMLLTIHNFIWQFYRYDKYNFVCNSCTPNSSKLS